MNAYVEFNAEAPMKWGEHLLSIGVAWSRSEPQPMADQVKLFDVTFPDGCIFPDWLRPGSE